jgi:hypothetical protein
MCGDCRACRGTDGANVGGRRRGRKVGTKMELRPQENDREEHRQDADALSSGLHWITKTKLRREWLRGQAPHAGPFHIAQRLLGSCKGSEFRQETWVSPFYSRRRRFRTSTALPHLAPGVKHTNQDQHRSQLGFSISVRDRFWLRPAQAGRRQANKSPRVWHRTTGHHSRHLRLVPRALHQEGHQNGSENS